MSSPEVMTDQRQVLEAIDHLQNICGALQGCVDFEVYNEAFDARSVQVYIQLLTHARNELVETLKGVSVQPKQEHMTSMLEQCDEIQETLQGLTGASGEALQDGLDLSALRCRLGKTMADIWQKWIRNDVQK